MELENGINHNICSLVEQISGDPIKHKAKESFSGEPTFLTETSVVRGPDEEQSLLETECVRPGLGATFRRPEKRKRKRK